MKLVKRLLPLLLVAFLFGIGIYSFLATAVFGSAMPMPFGMGVSVVMSGSMEPELSVNDVIIVKKTDTFWVGQVVVFQDGNAMTVHRIIEVGEDTVRTKGDANNAEDTPIAKTAIKGKVVAVIPYAGYVVQWLQSPLGALLIVLLALYLFQSSFRRQKNRQDSELEEIQAEIEKLTDEIGRDRR